MAILVGGKSAVAFRGTQRLSIETAVQPPERGLHGWSLRNECPSAFIRANALEGQVVMVREEACF
jgi:hypothetical protein